jgi:hypothetical protein
MASCVAGPLPPKGFVAPLSRPASSLQMARERRGCDCEKPDEGSARRRPQPRTIAEAKKSKLGSSTQLLVIIDTNLAKRGPAGATRRRLAATVGNG